MIDVGATMRMDGLVAIVTGASKGLGMSIAEHFCSAGASVVAVARTADELEATAASLRLTGAQVDTVVGDVSDAATVNQSIDVAMEQHGRIDVLVNNAAMQGPVAPLVECDPDDVARVTFVNQLAPLMWSRAVWSGSMSREGGAILNIISFSGLRPRLTFGAYGQAKAALDHQTRVLALELAPRVRVNSIAPGLVVTPMSLASTTEAYRSDAANARPLRRLGEPRDVALAALFLCSEASSWITGVTLPVDGGALLAT